MNLFDVVAGLTLLVSALAGLARGAVTEVVNTLAFAVAAALAVWTLPLAGPTAQAIVHPVWAADAAAVAVTFIVAYVGLTLAGAAISRFARAQGALGLLDRLGGLAFGVARALVLLGAVVLVFNATPMGAPPPLIRDGRLYPLARASADTMASLLPGGMQRLEAAGAALRARMDAESPLPPQGPVEAGQAYGPAPTGRAVVSQPHRRRHLSVEPQE